MMLRANIPVLDGIVTMSRYPAAAQRRRQAANREVAAADVECVTDPWLREERLAGAAVRVAGAEKRVTEAGERIAGIESMRAGMWVSLSLR